jgi:lipoprotein-releasing system permease protein
MRAKRKQVFVSIITFISILGIFLGVAALIIVLAVMNGFEEDLRTKILGIRSHIEITASLSGPMRDHQTLRRIIDQVPGVVASTPFIYTEAMIRSQNGVTGVVIRGLDTPSAPKVIHLGKIREGRLEDLGQIPKAVAAKLPPEDRDLDGILIGKEMARNLGLFLYDPVTIISPTGGIATPMGMVPKMKKFIVVGIYESGFYEYDSKLVFLSLASCQKFLDMGDAGSGIDVVVHDIYKADEIGRHIQGKLGVPFFVQNWIVMEKNKDIAILKSMGATSGMIMKIFIYQGLIAGAIGTFFGTLAGLLIATNLQAISQFVERVFHFKFLPGDVYYLSELPSKVNYGDVVIIVIGTLLICFLSTIYPSWRASKLDPAEALRYE